MENQTFDMSGLSPFPCKDLKSEMKAFFEGVKKDFEASNCKFLCDASGIFSSMWCDFEFIDYLIYIALVFILEIKNSDNIKLGVIFLFKSDTPRETRLAFLEFVLEHFDELFTFNGNTVTVNQITINQNQ